MLHGLEDLWYPSNVKTLLLTAGECIWTLCLLSENHAGCPRGSVPEESGQELEFHTYWMKSGGADVDYGGGFPPSFLAVWEVVEEAQSAHQPWPRALALSRGP